MHIPLHNRWTVSEAVELQKKLAVGLKIERQLWIGRKGDGLQKHTNLSLIYSIALRLKKANSSRGSARKKSSHDPAKAKLNKARPCERFLTISNEISASAWLKVVHLHRSNEILCSQRSLSISPRVVTSEAPL